MKAVPLGQLLIEGGHLTETQLEECLHIQQNNRGTRLGDLLVQLGYVTEDIKIQVLAKRLNVDIIDISNIKFQPEVVFLIPEDIAKKYHICAVKKELDGTLYVATSDPLDLAALDEVSMVSGFRVVPLLAKTEDIAKAIENNYANYKVSSEVDEARSELEIISSIESEQDLAAMADRVDSSPIVKLVNSIIIQGYRSRASDIHIEPSEDKVTIRYRIDGDLVDAMSLNAGVHSNLTTRIKIMGGIDIAERRIPQDGRFSMIIDNQDINTRLSTLPTIFGEKLVVRLLGDSSTAITTLDELGLTKNSIKSIRKLINASNGIVLITGPTGSGKTTTIYGMMNEIIKPTVNIVSLEDPVEKHITGINQVQINEKAGLTFAGGLRSILRQDPDVVMVGEIRDGETATIASRAAITGHLVLSTLHTNDAASSFMRLIDMGVDSYIVASSVNGVIAQRLVRLICPNCKQPYKPTDLEKTYFHADFELYKGEGCEKCNFTGHKGRTAVTEIAIVDSIIRQMITAKAPSVEIKKYMRHIGIKSLQDNILEIMKNGKTTIQELIRNTQIVD